MTHVFFRAVIAIGLAAVGTSSFADEPGPGGGGGKTQPLVTGEQIYQAVCQACHMTDAKGATGAATIPALAGNPKLASSAYLLLLITKGRGVMPSLSDTLDSTQIAAVANYVRTNFGNNYPEPVKASEVPAVPKPSS